MWHREYGQNHMDQQPMTSPTLPGECLPHLNRLQPPLKMSLASSSLAKQMSGRQMDTSHNQRAHLKRTLSPATSDPNKWAKIRTREDDMGDQTRHSRSTQP